MPALAGIEKVSLRPMLFKVNRFLGNVKGLEIQKSKDKGLKVET
jgi:hypothetical protein